MEEKVKELIKILNEELKLYKAMLKFSTEKSDALKERDLEKVAKLTSEEELILKEILIYEKKRTEALKNLLQTDISEDNQINVTKILNKLNDDTLKKELLEVKEKLKQTIEDLKIINNTNEKMIKDTLDIINYSFKIISKVTGQAATYSKEKIKGKSDKNSLSQQSMIFDKKF